MTTLGIDLGTSGVRGVVLDHRGAAQATHAVRIDPAQRRNPTALWTAVATVLHALDLSDVDALAVDGTSGTILPVTNDGTPLGILSLYNQAAPAPQQAAVAASGPPDSAAQGATSPLARAIAIQAGTNAARILHEADWIAGQLCGRYNITDENNALKTGYDPIAQIWPAWITAAGLLPQHLPTVIPAGNPIAPVTASAARDFAIPSNAMVVAGTTDGCASFLATGADQTGDAVTSLGSTLTLKLLADVPVFAPEYGIYSHRLSGRWLAGGASNTGGAVLAKFFTSDQIASLSTQIDPTRPSTADFYPLPAPGERFPINDPNLPPRLTPRPPDDATYLHALFESIARIEALGYQRLSQSGASAPRRVLTVGGGAPNPVWTKIRTRILGIPVQPASSTEAAHGAAILARQCTT